MGEFTWRNVIVLVRIDPTSGKVVYRPSNGPCWFDAESAASSRSNPPIFRNLLKQEIRRVLTNT